MAGKGDKRRPGDNYESGWDRIWGRHLHKVTTFVECPHCGYIDKDPELHKECSQGWICPACELVSRVYTNEKKEVWKVELGYLRKTDIEYGR